MINYSNCNIEQIAVHRIGNKTNGEDLFCSETNLNIDDSEIRQLLVRYFLKPFKNPEIYRFTSSNGDFTLNPLYKYISEIFNDSESFHTNSIYIAKHLYEKTMHPNIKSGLL